MEIETGTDSRLLSASDQIGLFLRWNDVEYPVGRLDEYTFVVNSRELANVHADAAVSAVYDGTIGGIDKSIEIQFRIRGTDGDRVRCSFFDLPIFARDRLAKLADGSRSPETNALQSLSYDELALGNTGENRVSRPMTPGSSSTLKKAIVSMMMAGSMLIIVGWVLMVVRSQATVAVSNGVMAGNYQAVNTPLDGKLLDLRVSVGDRVDAGQVMATVSNPAAKHEQGVVEAQLSRARRDLNAYRRQSTEIDAMLKTARASLQKKRLVAAAAKARIKAEYRAARSRWKRLKRLWRRQLTTISNFEKAQAEKDRWAAELKSQEAVIAGIVLAEKAAANDMIVSDSRITNPMSEIRTKIALARSLVGELQAMRDLLAARAKPAELVAPSAGTIFAVYRRPGDHLKRAEDAIAIARDGKSWATGHILFSAAPKIKPGQLVEIEIPSYGLKTTGVVQGIGHRAVHGRGGYSADFRGPALAVPIRVAINQTGTPIPSGLRLEMTVRVRDHAKEFRDWMDGSMVGHWMKGLLARIAGKGRAPTSSPQIPTVNSAALGSRTADATASVAVAPMPLSSYERR